jgi:hypothetical protein
MWPFDRWFGSRLGSVPARIQGRLDLTEWHSGKPVSQTWVCEQVTAQDLLRLHMWAVNGDFGDCRISLSDTRDLPFLLSLLCDHGNCREGRVADTRAKACKAYHPQARVFSQRGDFPGYCFVLVSADPAPIP